MLPETLVAQAFDLRTERLRYLDARDWPWLEALLALYRAHVGARRVELDEALAAFVAPRARAERAPLAILVLDRLVVTRVRTRVDPRTIRALLFAARPAGESRGEAVARVAGELGLEAHEVESWLFADTARERRVEPLPEDLGPSELAVRVNTALVQGFVGRAERVRIRAASGLRDVVRHAKLVGLMCTVTRSADGASVLDVSGPLSLFRSTRIYAAALASIVPRVAWCQGYSIEAHGHLSASHLELRVLEGDPIRPSKRPTPYDSKVESRFARDFARSSKDFDLHREPEPIEVAGQLIFPDFALVHRFDPSRRFLLEIVGFYTPTYVTRKLELLRAAGLERLVLCIDESLGVGLEALPTHARVVRYRRRVPVREVLAAVGEGGLEST